jgi:hypothetical protein
MGIKIQMKHNQRELEARNSELQHQVEDQRLALGNIQQQLLEATRESASLEFKVLVH